MGVSVGLKALAASGASVESSEATFTAQYLPNKHVLQLLLRIQLRETSSAARHFWRGNKMVQRLGQVIHLRFHGIAYKPSLAHVPPNRFVHP